MDVQAVLEAHLGPHLPDGLQEGQGLDVTHGAADLGDNHVRRVSLAGDKEDIALNLVGDVGDDLDGRAQIFAPALPVDDGLVHPPGGHVGGLGQALVHKALVVAQIQVGLRAVVGDKDFAVLIGVHGSGVNVDVRVELLDGYPQSAALEQPAQRGSGDTLAQGRHHAAGDEDELGTHERKPLSHRKSIRKKRLSGRKTQTLQYRASRPVRQGEVQKKFTRRTKKDSRPSMRKGG